MSVNVNVEMGRLFGLLLKEGDQIVTVLGLLETAKGHLGTGNVLLGVLEVLELCCVSIDCRVIFVLVGRHIRECRGSTRCPFACWHRCMSSQRRNQSCGRRGRVARGQSCCPHRPSGCGTERNGSTVWLEKVRRTKDATRDVSGVISVYPYLEEVGTLLSIACKDMSAVCMTIKFIVLPSEPSCHVANLPYFAHCLVGCQNLAGLCSEKMLLLREASCPCARRLNGRWKQEARRGRQNGRRPMTSGWSQENVPFS